MSEVRRLTYMQYEDSPDRRVHDNSRYTLCSFPSLLILWQPITYEPQYTFALLGTHPEVMKRLREEHDRIFGTDLATTAETIRKYPSKTNELEYTTAVLKEVMRFFPIGSATKENPAGS